MKEIIFNRIQFKKQIFFFLTFLVLIIISCTENNISTNIENQSPVIDSIVTNTDVIQSNEVILLNCFASAFHKDCKYS